MENTPPFPPLPPPTLVPRNKVGFFLTIFIDMLNYYQPLFGWPPPGKVGRAMMTPRSPTHPDYFYFQVGGIFNSLPTNLVYVSRSLWDGKKKKRANLTFLFGFPSQNFIYFQGVRHSGPMPRSTYKWRKTKGKGGERERGRETMVSNLFILEMYKHPFCKRQHV